MTPDRLRERIAALEAELEHARRQLAASPKEWLGLGPSQHSGCEQVSLRVAQSVPALRRLPCLVDALPGLVYVADAEGQSAFLNSVAYDAVRGEPGPPEITFARALRLPERISTLVSPHTTDLRIPAEGPERWWRVTESALEPDGDGAPRFVLGFGHDVTELRRAQEALAVSERRLNGVLAGAGLAACEVTLPTGRIRCDARGAELLGFTPETLPEDVNVVLALLHPDDIERVRGEVLRHLAGETPSLECEVRARRSDGSEVWVLARGRVIDRDPDGVARVVAGTLMDITARRHEQIERARLEAQLQQAQKLESLGVLAGGIAHDFNNLLCGVLGNVDLALLDLPQGHPAGQSMLEIRGAAQRATQLCRQMLAYSGRERLVTAPSDLSVLIERMEHLLRVSVTKKTSLRFELQAELPQVLGDASQLRQVLLNLVVNATESLGDRPGVVTVRTGYEHCDREYLDDTVVRDGLEPGEYVFMQVTDTGTGMDAETLRRVFDPFFTTKFLGRGLGLAAVLGIIRGHKGTVKLYSEVNRGTSVKVLLPALQVDASHAAVEPGKPWRGEGLVLLADDEPAVRGVGERMLRRLGFDVVVADDGRAALERFSERPDEIRVVLLDLSMPRLDGVETFRELRRVRPDTRVVLMSGYGSEATERFQGKGLAGFVQKPLRLEAVRDVLRSVLS